MVQFKTEVTHLPTFNQMIRKTTSSYLVVRVIRALQKSKWILWI